MQNADLTPKKIESIVKETIIGQDEGVRAVATAVAAHILRVEHNKNFPTEPIQKSNLLVIGPTGCGKTETIKTIIRELDLDIPIAVIDASSLTTSGYKGKNVEDILIDLAKDATKIFNQKFHKNYKGVNQKEYEKQAKNEILSLCNKGIIILDEIDKMRIDPQKRYDDNMFQRGCQQQLLKIIEGATGIGDGVNTSKIDTTDILFICSGAHIGLEDITKQRLTTGKYKAQEQKPQIGFVLSIDNNSQNNETTKKSAKAFTYEELLPTTEDLIEYGYIPELVGRIPMRCRYKPITANILYRILKESKASPAEQARLMMSDTYNDLHFTDGALRAIAAKAAKENTGVRGLKTIVEKITDNIYYEFAGNPNHTITVTMDTVLKKAPPEVTDFPDVPKIPNSEVKWPKWSENWEEDLLNLPTIKIKP